MIIKNKLKLTLLSISFLTMMASAAVAPIIGKISEEYPNADFMLIKMIVSVPGIAIIVFSLITGKLVRNLRKRDILITGLILYTIGGSGAAFSTSLEMLIGFRLIIGIGVGIIMPLATGLITDFYMGQEQAKMLGYSQAASFSGVIIMTYLVGVIANYGWRYSFGVYLLGLVVLLLVIFQLPEPKKKENEKADGETASLPKIVYVIAILITMNLIAFYSVLTNIALFFRENNILAIDKVGLAISALSFGSFIMGLFAAVIFKLFKNYGITLALLLSGIGYMALTDSHSFISVIIADWAIGMGSGFVTTVAYIKAAKIAQARTTFAMAVISSGLFLGQFLSPIVFNLVGAIFNDNSIRFGFKTTALSYFIAFLISLIYLSLSQKLNYFLKREKFLKF